MNPLIAKIAGRKDEAPCPGSKIRSKGKGLGEGRGKGKGPIGIPIGEKMKKESAVVAVLEKVAKKKKDKNWIAKATKNKGGLHRSLGVPEGKKIPKSKIEAAEDKPGKVGKQARLAATLEGLRKAASEDLAAALQRLGIAKEATKAGLVEKIKGGAKKAGKYAKWGGLGMGVYLALKALEGAKEARQEATHRW